MHLICAQVESCVSIRSKCIVNVVYVWEKKTDVIVMKIEYTKSQHKQVYSKITFVNEVIKIKQVISVKIGQVKQFTSRIDGINSGLV